MGTTILFFFFSSPELVLYFLRRSTNPGQDRRIPANSPVRPLHGACFIFSSVLRFGKNARSCSTAMVPRFLGEIALRGSCSTASGLSHCQSSRGALPLGGFQDCSSVRAK